MTLNDDINRGPWTKEEDEMLRSLVHYQQQHDPDQQAEFGLSPGRGEAKRELIGELGVDELGQQPCTPPPCPPEKQPEQ